jgi:mevalonate kinase
MCKEAIFNLCESDSQQLAVFGEYSVRFEIGGGALVAKIGIVKTANILTTNKADDRLQSNQARSQN